MRAPNNQTTTHNYTPPYRDDLNQPVFAAIDAFEFPELHGALVARAKR